MVDIRVRCCCCCWGKEENWFEEEKLERVVGAGEDEVLRAIVGLVCVLSICVVVEL